MSESIGGAQVELGVDASGVDAGVARAKKSIATLGDTAGKAGKDASKGVSEIGKAGADSAQKMDAQTKRLITSIERQTLALGKSKSEFYAAQAAIKGNESALAPYIAKLAAAEKANKKFGDSFGGIKAIAAVAAAGLSAQTFTGWISGAIEAADRMNDLSKSTDLSAASLAGLKLAAQQSGSDLDGTAKAINKLSVNIGKDAERFAKIGINAKAPIEAFKQLADLYTAIDDPQQRAALGSEALGKSWEAAAPLLAEGSKRIQEMIDKGTSLSGMTQGMATASDDFGDRMAELKTALSGTANILAGNMLPLLTAFTEELTNTVDGANKMDAAFDPLTETLRALVVVGGNVGFVFKGIGKELGGLAAQAAAFGSGDFRAAISIGDLMKEDAEKSRVEFDRWEKRMMSAGTVAKETAAAAKEAGAGLSAAQKKAVGDFVDPEKGKKAAAEAAQLAKQQWENRLKAIAAGTEHERALIELAHASGVASEEKYQQDLYRAEVGGLGKRAATLQKQLEATQDPSDRAKLAGDLSEVQTHAMKAADAYALAIAKMDAARKKALDAWATDGWKDAASLATDNDKLREELATLGLTDKALASYRQSKAAAARDDALAAAVNLEAAALIYDANAMHDAADAMRNMAAARRELAGELGKNIDLIGNVEIKKQAVKAAEDSAEAWKKFVGDLESSLTDALMRGFEAGNGFGENFVETLKNTLKTAGLKILVQAVVEPTMNTVRDLAGGGAPSLSSFTDGSALSKLASSASGAWGLINGSTITKGFSGLAESAAGANMGLSAQVPGLMGPTPSGAALSGYQITDLGKGIGSGLATAGAGIMGAAIGGAISKDFRVVEGVSAATAGAAVGAFMGPLGAFAGGIVGGIADRAFGMGKVELGGAGVQGTFAGSGFSGQGYQDWTQKGGWFQSDKSGTRTSALDAGATASLGGAFASIKTQVAALADSLNVETSAIAGYSKTIRQALDAGSVSALMESMANDMAALALAGTNYGKSGEAALATLTRLSSSLGTFNGWMERLALTLADVSLAGGDASSKLIDMLGGVEEFARKEGAYFDAFYSQSEKLATLQGDIAAKLGTAGLAVPESKADYRTLVAQANPMSDQGRVAHAALIELAPAFDALDKLLAESAAAAADALVSAFTADGRLAPGLAVFETAMAGMADTAAGAATDVGAISRLFLDASSGLLEFGPAALDIEAAQSAAVTLGDAMDAMRTAARAGTVDFNGLAKALHGVDTRTFMGALGKVFDGLADRLGGVVKDIAGLRTDLRADALRIADPVLMLPETILREIGTVGTTLPSMDALNNASAALVAADAAVASASNTLASASATMGSAYSTWQSYAGSATSANAALTSQVATFQAISGKNIPNHDAGYWNAALMDAQWSATNYGNTLSSYNPENVYVYESGWQQRASESGVTSTINPLVAAFNSAVSTADAYLANYNATIAPYNAASSSYSGAVSNQTAKSSIVQAETLAYSDALNAFALQAERGVAKLSRLRTETMKYYDAQSRLAELMKSSADGLRGAVAQYRFDQLDEMQKYNALQSDYATSYSLALSTTDDTLAGYADKMTSLLPSMLEAARSVLGDTQYNAVAATALARASAIADRVDALTPTDYAAESLAALEQIDLTLSALEDSAMTANQAIVKAIEAGKELTAAGLRNVVTALGKTPTFATGGYHVGGLRIVGERGPELEATGPSRIWSASQTRALLAPASGSSDPAMLAELQALRREVENLRAEARATATATAKTSRQLERFEIDGLTVRTEADSPLATVAA